MSKVGKPAFVTEKLTVFFENPFWVGVFERVENGKLYTCKITFGAEPKDYEVWNIILRNYDRLKFSPSVDVIVKKEAQNPKRRQREARKQTKQTGVGTRSQQALQLLREANKVERRIMRREQKLAEQQRNFELRRQKRKEKHRGR